MSTNSEPFAWRFVAQIDLPEHGIFAGDLIVAEPGGPTRIMRRFPVNNGLLLNLLLQDQIAEVAGVVGTERDIIDAMSDTVTEEQATTSKLRVMR